MDKSKIPCVCGHKLSDHSLRDRGSFVCVKMKYDQFADQCVEYKQDNLKYLEMLLHERK